MEETIVITRTYKSGVFIGKIVRRGDTVMEASISNGIDGHALRITNEWINPPSHSHAGSLLDLLELVKKMVGEAVGAGETEF